MARKNIKIDEETFDQLKERKPKGVTWDYFLRREVLGETDEYTERMQEERENTRD